MPPQDIMTPECTRATRPILSLPFGGSQKTSQQPQRSSILSGRELRRIVFEHLG